MAKLPLFACDLMQFRVCPSPQLEGVSLSSINLFSLSSGIPMGGLERKAFLLCTKDKISIKMAATFSRLQYAVFRRKTNLEVVNPPPSSHRPDGCSSCCCCWVFFWGGGDQTQLSSSLLLLILLPLSPYSAWNGLPVTHMRLH